MAKRKKKKQRQQHVAGQATAAREQAPSGAETASVADEDATPAAAPALEREPSAAAAPSTAAEQAAATPAPAETPGPARLSVRRVLGAAAVAAAVIVAVSGLYLLFGYEEARAHDAMKELVGVAPLGALMRALHRLGADALLVLLGGLLLAQLFARVPDRPAAQLVTLALAGVVGGLTCTGEPLPWDRQAVARAGATTELGRSLPVIGALQGALRGGDAVGDSTRRRSFYLHLLPLPLPLAAIVLLIVRLRLARRPGPRPPLLLRPELAVALLAVAALLAAAAGWPVPLGPAADARLVVDPSKAPWYLAGWQEVDSYAPLVGVLFGALLVLLFVLEARFGPARETPHAVPGRVLALTVGGLLVGLVVAGAAVWWWRDPSYGAPSLLNPATIALLVGALLAAGALWRTGSRPAALRALLGAVVGAALIFTLVGWLGRGPRWELAWHPGSGDAAEAWPR